MMSTLVRVPEYSSYFFRKRIKSAYKYFWDTFSRKIFILNPKKGHKEDIIAATCVHGNLLVTASFDGVIIVWNMVSGHAVHRKVF